jgi:cytoskeletal protein RodZ
VSYVEVPEKTQSTTESGEIGALLKQTRLQRGISLEDVSRQTFIKLHYLYALEEGQIEQLPAPVYTSGYIRQYARLLNLEEAALIRQYHEQIGTGLSYNRTNSPEVVQFASEFSAQRSGQFTPILSQRNGSTCVDEISFPVTQNSSLTGVSRAAMSQSTQATSPSPVSVASSDKRVVETIEGARKEALVMRHQTEQYADTVLKHVEDEIEKTLSVIRNGRTYLQNRLDAHQRH